MSNAIKIRSAGMLAPSIGELIPSEWRSGLGKAWSLGPHTEAVKHRAAEVLDALSRFGHPADETLVRSWFAPIGAAVCNPKTGSDVDGYMSALMLTLDGVPAGAFTIATQRQLLRQSNHWPSCSEVYAVVAPAASRIWDDIEGLRRMVAAPTKQEVA